ncbi:MAG: DNA polymerase III subunit beta [Cyclobacteriaceae bacterium]
MKFVVSSTTLLKQLSAINGVIASNPVVPILENFLCEIQHGTLKITASDLQTTIMTELDVDAQESGSIAVPAKILIETLRNLPEQPVTFTIDEASYNIEIHSENGHYRLSGENATDFPKVPAVEDGNTIEVPADVLAHAVSNTLFATSADELRPAMTGVYVNLNGQGSTFVATDGHRLVRYRRTDVSGGEGKSSIIVPRKALNLLKTVLPSENTTVSMRYNASNAFFQFSGTSGSNVQMVCRLIDERYPDYENVIPQDNENQMVINRQDFLSSLKRIAIYANKTTHQVRLKLDGNKLHISAEDLDFSNEANETLVCDHQGEDLEIGFNARFLIEMLNNIESEEVTFKFSQPNRAGLIVPNESAENEEVLMLVMPVMLSIYV